MAPTGQDKLSTEDMLQGHAELSIRTVGFVKSMALKCAMEFGIPGAIHCNGAVTLDEPATTIKLPPSRFPRLHRLMSMLTVSRVFTVHQPDPADGGEAVYGLTPTSCLLVYGETSSSLPLVLGSDTT